jgi:hypothetical protein
MKKFEGWRTEELQYVATLIAGRDLAAMRVGQDELYNQIIREIRNRRIAKELFQTKLNLEERD